MDRSNPASPRTGRLAGKTALVTGAARGLGAASAAALAREGAMVLLTDRDEAGVSAAADAINTEAGAAIAFSMAHDVTREDHWAAAIARAEAAMGGLSVLVNNAGIIVAGSVEDLDLDQWRLGMSVNVESVFIGVKAALPLLRDNQPASIVNLSSVSGLIASHNFANYNATKAAVWLLSKSIALHCARRGWDIRSNTIHPSFVRTPILDDLRGQRDEEETLAKLARQIPLGRIGEPEEIAQAVVYLASDESRFMTGAELKLDGGITAM